MDYNYIYIFLYSLFTMALTLVGPWLCGHPFRTLLTDHLTEQTRKNMSQPGPRLGTTVGDERHVLQALWSRNKPAVQAAGADPPRCKSTNKPNHAVSKMVVTSEPLMGFLCP